MKLVKLRNRYFLVGTVECAICENPVVYKLSLKLAEHYLSNPLLCEDCDPVLKVTQKEGIIITYKGVSE